MSLFTEAIEMAQKAALGWPVTVVSRETDDSHMSGPGRVETHLICLHNGCRQSAFRLQPLALDAAHKPIDQEYTIQLLVIMSSVAAHIRQCHEDAIRM